MSVGLEGAVDGAPYVYFLLDGDHEVTYIGCTRHLRRRISQHRRSRPWEYVTAYPYPTLDAALADEARLIALAQPPLNSNHRQRGGPSVLELMADLFVDGQLPTDDDLRLMALLSDASKAA